MSPASQPIYACIPKRMEPGTLYLLAQSEDDGDALNPFRAVLACPACGTLGLITRSQYSGGEAMICGSAGCSAEYMLAGELIHFRAAQ